MFHDDYHAFYDLTRLVLDKGRSRLGYIGVMQQDIAVGEERYKAFQDAVHDTGHGGLAENYVVASFTVSSGYERRENFWKNARIWML